MSNIVEVSASGGSTSGGDSVTIQIRTSLIQQRIESAVMFAKHAQSIEQADGRERGREHRGYVIAAITECGAFLESIASEFICNVQDDCSTVPILTDDLKQTFKAVYDYVEKLPVVDKFNKILELSRLQTISLGSTPGQDVKTVIALRNDLVHYKPKWRTGPSSDNRIGKLDGKFPTNPFTGESNPFFPDRCLSYGCTKWAVESCIGFSDEFYSRIQVIPPYDAIRNQLVI